MARVAVPFLGVALSRPLPVIDLVSLYLANYLIGRRPFPKRLAPLTLRCYGELPRLSTSYAPLLGMYPRVTKPFAGCPALRRDPRDLHAGIHVTSVHPELGSNSQIKHLKLITLTLE